MEKRQGELRYAEEICDCEEGKELLLVFDSGDQYHGFFKEVDDDQILLKSLKSNDMIGLPLNRLKAYIELL